MKVTKREIIISIAIAAVMLIIGFFISGKITDAQNDKNAEYQKAVHIENSELFLYGMDTNAGNAFVYGDLQAIDAVTFDEIGGEYLNIRKVKEKRERHERKKKVNNRIVTEVYYEWEPESEESKTSGEILFCETKFPYKKIPYINDEYIETINADKEYSWNSLEYVKVRYIYYGTPFKHTGTIYTKLSDGTISDNSIFFKDCTIEQVLDSCTSDIGNIIFWVLWIMLTIGAVIGFCYLDNRWLED